MSGDSAQRKKIVMCSVCWRAWDWEAANVPKAEFWVSLDDLLKSRMVDADQYMLSEGYCPECLVALLQASHVSYVQEHPAFMAQAPSSLL